MFLVYNNLDIYFKMLQLMDENINFGVKIDHIYGYLYFFISNKR